MRALLFCLFIPFWVSFPCQGYEVIEVTDGGTIKGRITYTGEAVEPRPVIVSKDQETCGHEPRQVPRVETGPEGGLAGAVVLLEGIPKGKDFKPRENELVLDQKGCQFLHNGTELLRVGEVFKVRNSDPVLHNIHAKQNKVSVFNQGQPFQGMEFENHFEDTGPVIINCDAHSWMWAFSFVTEHPYVTLTQETGDFELADIPEGKYNLRVWHPYLGEQTQEVEVKAKGTTESGFEYTKRIRGRS